MKKERENVIINEEELLKAYEKRHNFKSFMVPHTVKELLDAEEEGILIMALCQRLEVTSEKGKSNLVSSALIANGIGELQISESKGIMKVLNGQQRFTALKDFYNNKFALNLDNCLYLFQSEEDEIIYRVFNGKKYSDLSEGAKQLFLNKQVYAETYYNLSLEDETNIYIMTNTNATKLNNMECAKAKMTPLVWNKIEELASNPVFSHMPTSLTDKRLARFKNVCEQVCTQTGYLNHKDFMSNIYDLISYLNSLDEEELNRVLSNFLKEMKMYSDSTLYAAAKNLKSFSKNKRETYSFFDDRALFYIFHKRCLKKDGFSQKMCDDVKKKAMTLFTSTKKSLSDSQNNYKNITNNATDTVDKMKLAASLILGEV